jgi:hypothetical protein
MIKKSKLKSWADDLRPVLFDINIAMSNLHILKHSNAEKFRVNHYDVYLNLWYQQNFILITQLAKLFSDSKNQKRNIIKLCRQYKIEGLDVGIKKLLSENEATSYKSREQIIESVNVLLLEIESNQVTIEKIIDLRDEVFAHTDQNPKEQIIDIEKLTNLCVLANRIYNNLFGKVFNNYEHFQITAKYDLRSIIEKF